MRSEEKGRRAIAAIEKLRERVARIGTIPAGSRSRAAGVRRPILHRVPVPWTGPNEESQELSAKGTRPGLGQMVALGGAVTQSSGSSPRQEREGNGGAGTDQAGIRSAFQREGLRVLDKVLDSSQELGRLATVHDAVIEAECHIHHRADDDLTTPRDGPILDLVKA